MIADGTDRWTTAVLVAVLDAGARALVLGAVAIVVLALIRPRRPELRLAVWTIVLFAAMAMPFLGMLANLTDWSLPIPVDVPVSLTTTKPRAVDHAAITLDMPSPAIRPPDAAAPSSSSWVTAVAIVYLAGVFVLLGRAAVGWWMTRRLLRDARPIRDALPLDRVRHFAAARGMHRAPGLAETAQIAVPVTTAVIAPVVLLPADWRDWSPTTLDAVLAHEVAHAARRDSLTQRCSLIYRALTWCHPFSWWLHHHLADLAEQASDAAVLETGTDRRDYARTLVDFFARVDRPSRRGAWHVAMARHADAGAERRVDRILGWKGTLPMSHSRLVVAAAILTAIPAVALTAVLDVRTLAAAELPVPERVLLQLPPLPADIPEPATPVTPRPRSQSGVTQQTAPRVAGRVALTIGVPRPGDPAVVVTTTSTADAGYASIVVRNDAATTIRALQVAAFVRPKDYPLAAPRVLTSPLLTTLIAPQETRTLEPRLIGAAMLTELGSLWPQGATATLEIIRVEFSDQTLWTPAMRSSGPTPSDDPDEFRRGTYSANTVGLFVPQALREVRPNYTSAAMREKIQGLVVVEVVVMADGSVGRARIKKSLDPIFGLDAEALAAAAAWKFTAPILNGQPVAVHTELVLEFWLH